LGGLFLFSNSLVIDHQLRTCIDKKTGYDLLNPPTIKQNITKPKPRFGPQLRKQQKVVVKDLKSVFPTTLLNLDNSAASAVPCPLTAMRSQIEQIMMDEMLTRKGEKLKEEYIDIFPPDILIPANYLTKSS
jgi:hypothetical protein